MAAFVLETPLSHRARKSGREGCGAAGRLERSLYRGLMVDGSPLSEVHRAALREGREQGRAVRVYLEALERRRPRRGRERTEQAVLSRLAVVERQLLDSSSVERLLLVQEQMDLQAELAGMSDGVDWAAIEADFVAAAKAYGARKGVSAAAWIQVGVPADVLRRAGIVR